MQSARRRLGRVRRRQHALARARAPVPGLRRGDRRAERRRDRARGRDAGRARARPPPAGRDGVRWLIEHQEPDGSWFGRWGVNHVYGTGAAVPALIAAGVEPSHPCIRRAIAWLEGHQNEDGGWGEDPRSYDDSEWIGRGPSTASQTAWALLALHAAGERTQALWRGVALARVHAARRRRLGRAAVHRHRLPVRLLHQLPPLPARRSRSWPSAAAWPWTLQRTLRATAPSDGSDADSRRADPRPRRGGGDGARRDGELPRRQPRAAQARARPPARGVRLRAARRRAGRLGRIEAGGTAGVGDPKKSSPRWTGSSASSTGRCAARPHRPRGEHPLLARLAVTVRECGLAREPFARLIEANRVDQRVARYETWEQLRGYCALSADPVGELVLGIFGLATPERIALSDSICTALQLTEHCQDVAEDLAARAHLPAGRGPASLWLRRGGPGGRARERAAARDARVRGRACARPAGRWRAADRPAAGPPEAGGRRVRRRWAAALEAIERARYDVLAGPPRAGRARRAAALAATLRSARSAGPGARERMGQSAGESAQR